MTQQFIVLAQSVSGNVITIVALNLVAAVIGYLIAWYYAASVYKPVIREMEKDKSDLKSQLDGLTNDFKAMSNRVNTLSEKISQLEEDLELKKTELATLSDETMHTGHLGKFVVDRSKNNENYFNLKAANGQVILTSIMFPTTSACSDGIESVRQICSDDEKYERKHSSNNKHYFNLKTPEGIILGKSQMYESESGMEKGIASVKHNGITGVVVAEKGN